MSGKKKNSVRTETLKKYLKTHDVPEKNYKSHYGSIVYVCFIKQF